MKPVDGAPLPGLATAVGDWIVFSDQQTGKLDQANDRIANGLSTIKRCEERDAAAIKKVTKRGLF